MNDFFIACLPGWTGDFHQLLNQAGEFFPGNIVVGPAEIAVAMKDFGDSLFQRFAPVGGSLFVSQTALSSYTCAFTNYPYVRLVGSPRPMRSLLVAQAGGPLSRLSRAAPTFNMCVASLKMFIADCRASQQVPQADFSRLPPRSAGSSNQSRL
jgi:hypothetical protein